MSIRIHPSAEVSDTAQIGDGTSIWHQSQVRPDAVIGRNCILGKGVYVDTGVKLGDNVKIQNYVSVFHGVCVEDGVFIGPHVCFTNDMNPRAINPDGSLKLADDWVLSETLVKYGSSIGANSTIRCGITLGEWSMIGAGSVVTASVPAYGLVYGNPARIRGFVCPCGHKLAFESSQADLVTACCSYCERKIELPMKDWQRIL
jgi:UDP-2-acetamido-3-amino-2,3-dideoxy-glucuronate N-acetyltransferase